MIQETIHKALQGGLYENLSSFIHFFYNNWWIVIGIYIVFIGINILRIHYTKKTLFPIQQKANQELDSLWYQSSSILYKHKDSLHNLSENIILLLHYKTECLLNNSNPRSIIEKIYEEYAYIYQLAGQKPTIIEADVVRYKNIMLKLQQTENGLKTVLGYLTIGISRLFL